MTWENVLRVLVRDVLPALTAVGAPVLVALAGWAFARLARKLGIETSGAQQAAITRIVDDAIAYGEHRAVTWAAEQGDLPSTAKQLEWTVSHVMKTAADMGLPALAEQTALRYIEARLGHPDAPGGENSIIPSQRPNRGSVT